MIIGTAMNIPCYCHVIFFQPFSVLVINGEMKFNNYFKKFLLDQDPFCWATGILCFGILNPEFQSQGGSIVTCAQ